MAEQEINNGVMQRYVDTLATMTHRAFMAEAELEEARRQLQKLVEEKPTEE